MAYDPKKHHRRSIRLKGYDYTQPGAYFVTICTKDRAHLFGRVVGGQVRLSRCGHIAREEWLRTAEVRPYVELDAYVVMPDHVHGILVITGDDRRRSKGSSAMSPYYGTRRTFGGAIPGSLSTIMRQYKSIVTKRINRLWGAEGGSVWHRNYWEHVIRSDRALRNIRRYIADNPRRWEDRTHMR